MKKFYLSLAVVFACLMVSCGNAEIDKINQMVVDATEQTQAAETLEEIIEIASNLQAEMDKIEKESGDKISFGKSVEEALTKYQEVAAAKLAEFGIELE